MSDTEMDDVNNCHIDPTLETELAQPAKRSRVRIIENSPGGEVLLRFPDNDDALASRPNDRQDCDNLADLKREMRGIRSDLDRMVAAAAVSPLHHAGSVDLRNSWESVSQGREFCHGTSSLNPSSSMGRRSVQHAQSSFDLRMANAGVFRQENERIGISNSAGETHGRLEGPPVISCHFREQGDVPRAVPDAEIVGRDATSGKNKKPATYDGSSNWQDYLVHFDMISQLNNWGETTKALELATSLRGVAQGVLSDMRPELRYSYQDLVSALTTRFQPENQSELYRAQIKNRIRQKGESLTELAHDIKRLTRLAYPAAPLEVRDKLARDCFIDSLNDSEMEWSIFQSKPSSAEDAVRSALEYEAFQQGRKRRLNGGKIPNLPVRMQSEGKNDEFIDEIVGRLAAMQAPATRDVTPTDHKKCFYCGKEGHFRRNCAQRKRDLDKAVRNMQANQGRQNLQPRNGQGN